MKANRIKTVFGLCVGDCLIKNERYPLLQLTSVEASIYQWWDSSQLANTILQQKDFMVVQETQIGSTWRNTVKLKLWQIR